MSIYDMIDAVVCCVICGSPKSVGCRCWVRLRCERCPATTVVEREPDFFDFDEIVTVCPECGREDET